MTSIDHYDDFYANLLIDALFIDRTDVYTYGSGNEKRKLQFMLDMFKRPQWLNEIWH